MLVEIHLIEPENAIYEGGKKKGSASFFRRQLLSGVFAVDFSAFPWNQKSPNNVSLSRSKEQKKVKAEETTFLFVRNCPRNSNNAALQPGFI